MAPIGREILSEFDVVLVPAEWAEGAKMMKANQNDTALVARGQNVERGQFPADKGGKGGDTGGKSMMAQLFGKGPPFYLEDPLPT